MAAHWEMLVYKETVHIIFVLFKMTWLMLPLHRLYSSSWLIRLPELFFSHEPEWKSEGLQIAFSKLDAIEDKHCKNCPCLYLYKLVVIADSGLQTYGTLLWYTSLYLLNYAKLILLQKLERNLFFFFQGRRFDSYINKSSWQSNFMLI